MREVNCPKCNGIKCVKVSVEISCSRSYMICKNCRNKFSVNTSNNEIIKDSIDKYKTNESLPLYNCLSCQKLTYHMKAGFGKSKKYQSYKCKECHRTSTYREKETTPKYIIHGENRRLKNKYRRENVNKLIELLKEGFSQSDICQQLNVDITTVSRWITEYIYGLDRKDKRGHSTKEEILDMIYKREYAIYLYEKEYNPTTISDMLGFELKRVENWINKYNKYKKVSNE